MYSISRFGLNLMVNFSTVNTSFEHFAALCTWVKITVHSTKIKTFNVLQRRQKLLAVLVNLSKTSKMLQAGVSVKVFYSIATQWKHLRFLISRSFK